MLKMFGRGYEEVGDSKKGLILKNSGKVKIQWGNKFIDLLDSNGNLNVKVQSLIKKVSSEQDMKQDGFYYLNDGLVAKIGDNILEVASDSGTVYVSFLQEQETTNEQKYTALKNIGFVYKDINKQNIYPKNGIIYIENEQALYIVNEGQLSKYVAQIPNPFTEQFIIRKNENQQSSEGALIIEGEGASNSLKFNTLKIYSEGFNSILQSDREFQFNVNNNRVVTMNQSGIYSNGIQSYNASDTYGYRIQQSNGKYVLDIDKINVREPILTEVEKYNIPQRIYNKENIILSTKSVYNDETNAFVKYIFNLKYKNSYNVENTIYNIYNVGDIIKTYVEVSENDYKKLIVPVSIAITEISPQNSEENYICATSITPLIQTEENITDIYNSHCFLYKKKLVNNELIDNKELIIGELDQSDRYKTDQNNYPISNGIISKQNIFYSAKFDKEGTGNQIFPFYTQALYEELNSNNNYKSNDYKYVIPPIQIVNNIVNSLLKSLLAELNNQNPTPNGNDKYLYYNNGEYEWASIDIPELGPLLLALNSVSVPSSAGYLYYNNGNYTWDSGVQLGSLLQALNSVNTPSSEGYLHYTGSGYNWQMPSVGSELNPLLDYLNQSTIGQSTPAGNVGKCIVYAGNGEFEWATPGGGGNQDLFDTIMLQNKNNTLTATSSTNNVRANQSGTNIVTVTSNAVWNASSNSLTLQDSHGIGTGSFSFQFSQNYQSTSNRTWEIEIKDIFYDRLSTLEDSTANNHYKKIIFKQLGKKSLTIKSGSTSRSYDDTAQFDIVLNSSFGSTSCTSNQSYCSVQSVSLSEPNETLTISLKLTQNDTSSSRTATVSLNTIDGQSKNITITQGANPNV